MSDIVTREPARADTGQSRQDTTGRTVLDATRALMRDLDLTTIFGNPGSTEEPFLKDWPAEFTYVLGLQEASALGMANGWSYIMHRPALVNLHTAAGVGNAMGNIVNAWYNKAPLIILAGQQTREMLAVEPFLTNVDATTLPRPYVKFSYEPMRAGDLPGALMRAYAAAVQPPSGPVFLSAPVDDWDKPEGRRTSARGVSFRIGAPAGALRELAEALTSARSPALIVGDGLRRARGWTEVIAFAEHARCAVFSGPFDPGAFPEEHPLYRGMLPPAIAPLHQALMPFDTVLVVGTPLFRYYPYAEGDYVPEGVRVFQVSDDPEETARAPVGTAILADPADALTALTSLLPSTDREGLKPRHRPAEPPPATLMTTDHLLHALSLSRPPRAVLSFEAPTALSAVERFWPVAEPDAFFFPAGGGLGAGLPAAVGMALAERQLGRNRPVIAIIGDGAIHYSIQALYTAVALSLPVIVIVPENGGYAILKQFARASGISGVAGLEFKHVDIVSIARGYGCFAARADTRSDVGQAFREALSRSGPTVIVSAVEVSLDKLL